MVTSADARRIPHPLLPRALLRHLRFLSLPVVWAVVVVVVAVAPSLALCEMVVFS